MTLPPLRIIHPRHRNEKQCQHCGEMFFRKRSPAEFARRKYCGELCQSLGNMVQWDKESLFSRTIPEPNSGCWLWDGAVIGGYGISRLFGEPIRAHRLSWILFNRWPIPHKMDICHKCDVPLCVNPNHLFLGTRLENIRDMHRKGRANTPRGERSGSARLTAKEVLDIRADQALTQEQLANKYGVSPSTIHSIKSRKNWAHL